MTEAAVDELRRGKECGQNAPGAIQIRRERAQLPVIMVTGYGGIEEAIRSREEVLEAQARDATLSAGKVDV